MTAEAAVSTGDEDREAAERLEAALERIARHAGPTREAAREPDLRLSQVRARIDALIATLKNALGKETEG